MPILGLKSIVSQYHMKKWLKTFLELPSGIPSHDTIQRVISIINPSALYTSTVKYLINLIDNLATKTKEKDIKSMDGKTINGSSRSELTTDKILPTNVMSIYSHNYGMSIIQHFIEEKSNEIPMGSKINRTVKLKQLHNNRRCFKHIIMLIYT